jgi:hypothetical protein
MLPVHLDGSEVSTLENTSTGIRLSVIASRGMCFSAWRMTPEEQRDAAAGKPVWVVIRGEIIPEYHLAVGNRRDVVPPEIIRRAQKTDALVNSEVGQELLAEQSTRAKAIEILARVYAVITITITIGLLCILGGWLVTYLHGR